MPPSLLLIEQSNALSTLCNGWHQEDGYLTKRTQPSKAEVFCRDMQPTAALTDLRQVGAQGLRLVTACLKLSPRTRFVVIGQQDSARSTMEAIRAGAHDYLPVPVESARLRTSISAALGHVYATCGSDHSGFPEMIGSSHIMRNLCDRIRLVAKSTEPVFITGETGTGKMLCARAIHRLSDRASKPFVALTCNGLDHQAVDTQSTGTEGTFDAAIRKADGGTLFMDGVCDLAPTFQNRLLHLLNTGTLPGPKGAVPIDLRVVCSSNREVPGLMRSRTLRPDLFYRLNVLPVYMPPLRDRSEDAVEIAEILLRRLNTEEGRNFSVISDRAKQAITAYPWPGNVLELTNVLRQVILVNTGHKIKLSMLPAEIAAYARHTSATEPEATSSRSDIAALVGKRMLDIEREVIEATIQQQGGSVPKAAEVLGLSPSTIYRKRDGWR